MNRIFSQYWKQHILDPFMGIIPNPFNLFMEFLCNQMPTSPPSLFVCHRQTDKLVDHNQTSMSLIVTFWLFTEKSIEFEILSSSVGLHANSFGFEGFPMMPFFKHFKLIIFELLEL
jgi:hypothetical protein